MSTDGSALGYAELLKLAGSGGLQELDSTIVQIPAEQNAYHGVVLASVRTSRGLFRAVGEAWRDSLPAAQREQTLTVAEVRAKTRALCEAVGMPRPLPAVAEAAPVEGSVTSQPPRNGTGGPSRSERYVVGGETSPHGGGASGEVVSARQPEAAPRPQSGPAAPGIDREARGPASGAAALEAAPESKDADDADARPARAGGASRQPARPAPLPVESLGPDMLAKLLQMTRRKATMEGNPATEEEAMRRLNSYFQRAFGHDLSEASRMEGQRVVQRLAADLARMSAESGGLATG